MDCINSPYRFLRKSTSQLSSKNMRLTVTPNDKRMKGKPNDGEKNRRTKPSNPSRDEKKSINHVVLTTDEDQLYLFPTKRDRGMSNMMSEKPKRSKQARKKKNGKIRKRGIA